MLKKVNIVILILIIHTPNLLSDWVFDNFVEVQSKKSKVIKFNSNYYVLENDNNSIILTEHSKDKIETSIIDKKYDDHFCDFDIDTNRIVYNGFNYISYYDYEAKKLTNKINNVNKPLGNIEIIGDDLYSYSSDLSNMACFNDTKTMVNITNTNNWNQQLFCFPDPNGIDLSSFVPSKIIAILNNLIVVQDVSNYRIKFYDFDYNYVDSIEHYPLEWKQYEGEIPKYNCDPEIMVHIEKCWSIIENYSKIDLINTLNDSTLLVTWRNINTSNQIRKFTYYHDILKKIDNKWEIGRDYFLQFNDTTDCFTLNRLNIKANYYIKKGYLYIIKPFPINLVKKYHGKKYSDFEDEMNNFYIVNDLQYTCFIFKYMP